MARNVPQKSFFEKSIRIDNINKKIVWFYFSLAVISVKFNNKYILLTLAIIYLVIEVSNLFINHLREKAENIRRKDFFNNSYAVKSIALQSENYYDNDDVKEGLFKVFLNLGENSLFSKEISNKMLSKEKVKFIVSISILIIMTVFGFVDNNYSYSILQILFSRILIISYFELFMYNLNMTQIYDEIEILIENGLNNENYKNYEAQILRLLVKYETNISNYKIFLDSHIYNELNPLLTEQWNATKEKIYK